MSLSSSFVVSTLSDYLSDLLYLRQPIKIPKLANLFT